MAKRDLSWTTKCVVFSGGVCTDYRATWIHPNPSAETGDQSVTITTDEAKSKSDPLSGCVIFTATLSDGNEISSSVTVVRCAYKCDCSKISGVTTYSGNIPVSGARDVELISFEIGGGCTDEVSFVYETGGTWYELSKTIDNDTVKLIGYFSENTTGSRNLTVKVKVNGTICTDIVEGGEFNFTQEGVSCGCADLIINSSAYTIGCEASSYTITNAFEFNCQGDNPPVITANTTDTTITWVKDIVVNQSGSVAYRVLDNTGSSSRTAILRFSAGTESCGDKTITIHQSPCDCNCSTVGATTIDQEWAYGNRGYKAILTTVCDATFDTTGIDANTWEYNATATSVSIRPRKDYEASCGSDTSNISIKVSVNGVECGTYTSHATRNGNTNISISASTDTIDCEGGTATFTIN